MSVLPQLLRAELLRLRHSRTTWLLVAAMVLVTFAVVLLTLDGQDAGRIEDAEDVRRVLAIGGSIAPVVALVVGILGTAGEYRHETIGQALLAAPRRWPVMVAKAISSAGAGLVLGVLALVVTFAVGLPGLADQDAGASLGDAPTRGAAAGTLVSAACFGAIGAGLGALLRDQSIALSVGLGWTLVVDPLATGLVPEVAKVLPGGLLAALLRTETEDVLPVLGAALLLAAFALAFVAVAAAVVVRRDLVERRERRVLPDLPAFRREGGRG